MKKRKIKVGGKIIIAKECRSIISKTLGIMFKSNPEPLVFVFRTPTRAAIHSFFCVPFRAIWILNGKIIDDKIIKPYKISIKPKTKYDTLIEIPLNNCNKS